MIWSEDEQGLSAGEDRRREMVRCAGLAPSSHNTQPWKFRIEADAIRVYTDPSRALPVNDPGDRELYISIGCALENMRIAGQTIGLEGDLEFPAGDGPCAIVSLSEMPPAADPLYDAIPRRQSQRSAYNGLPLADADLQTLRELALPAGTAVQVITAPAALEQVAGWVAEGDRRQYANPDFVAELVSWLRFNQTEALKTLDGLYAGCSGNPSGPRWVGKLFVNTHSGESMGKKDGELVKGSSGLLLVTSAADERADWLAAGMAGQRLMLTLTRLGIDFALMNQPLEIPELRQGVLPGLGLDAAGWPQLLLRIGHGKAMPRSLRRPLEEILAA